MAVKTVCGTCVHVCMWASCLLCTIILQTECKDHFISIINRQGAFITGILTAVSAARDWNEGNGQQSPTILYLHAKFQLLIYCTSWDIVWQKNVTTQTPTNLPTRLAQLDTAEPQLHWGTNLQLLFHFPLSHLFQYYVSMYHADDIAAPHTSAALELYVITY